MKLTIKTERGNEKETKMTDKKIRQRWKNDKIVQNA